MLVSSYIGFVILAAALAAGALLSAPRLLTGLIALLPLIAWIDVQRGAHAPASALIAAGLLLAAAFRMRSAFFMAPAADSWGARGWWWAFALFALGQGLALFWLMPFPGHGAALSALSGTLPKLYAGNANYFEYVLSAAAQLLVIPVAATALAALLADTERAALVRAVRRGFQGTLLTGGCFVLAGLAGWGGGALMKGFRFNAGLPDPNSAGTFYLLVCAALLATLPLRTAGAPPLSRRDDWFARGWLLPAVLLLLATGSRIALFALPLVILFFVVQRGAALKKILIFAPLSAAAAFGLLYLAYRLDQRALIPFIHPGAVTHIYQALTPDYIASQGLAFRGAYWTADLRAWLDAPLAGIGVGRLYGAMGQYMKDMPWPIQYLHENAHNQWLQWLAELGLIGFALAAAAQIQSWRAASPVARLLLLAFALTAITGHPLLVPAMAFFLGVILALPGIPSRGTVMERMRPIPLWRRLWPLAALPLGLLVARPHFSFAGHVRGEGAPLPELQARWAMSCPLWRAIHPGAMASPLRLEDPAARRGAITLMTPPPDRPAPNGVFTIPVRLTNLSAQSWPAGKDCSGAVEYVHLAYHWQPRAGSESKPVEGHRTRLPADLPPGESITVELAVTVPANPGDYVLVPDALQEGVAWFELPVTPK